MDREALLALVRRSTCIDLTCETLFCPDLGRPTAERPLDFVFRVAGGACTYFSPSERAFVAVDERAHARLLTLAEEALAGGNRHPVPDTAVGRHITTLTLRVDSHMGPAREVQTELNHYSYSGRLDDRAWVELLCAFADLASPRSDDDLARWAFVMRACPASLVAPVLSTPLVMPVEPGRFMWFVALEGRGIYLRLGQPPGDSKLYRIAPRGDGAEVIVVDEFGREGDAIARLSPRVNAVERWAERPSMTPYREAAGPEVEVLLADARLVAVRAGLRGRGVYVQRA